MDSFPGETFTATVSHIADQAEFTPRNVQTTEGRTSTVFAIKLQVQDPRETQAGDAGGCSFYVERSNVERHTDVGGKGMTAITRFEEIQAWQTARQLTNLVYKLTGQSAFAKDFGLKDQDQAGGSIGDE